MINFMCHFLALQEADRMFQNRVKFNAKKYPHGMKHTQTICAYQAALELGLPPSAQTVKELTSLNEGTIQKYSLALADNGLLVKREHRYYLTDLSMNVLVKAQEYQEQKFKELCK